MDVFVEHVFFYTNFLDDHYLFLMKFNLNMKFNILDFIRFAIWK